MTEAGAWDAHYLAGGRFRPLTGSERRLLAEHVPTPPGGLALDVGCGTGELARHLADTGWTVDAVDLSATALAEARSAEPEPEPEPRPGSGPEPPRRSPQSPQPRTSGPPARGTPARPARVPVRYLRYDITRADGWSGGPPLHRAGEAAGGPGGGTEPGRLPHGAYDLVVLRLSIAFLPDRTRLVNRLARLLRPGGTVCVVTARAESAPAGRRHSALDAEEIEALRAGWSRTALYDAEGLAFLVLRGLDPGPVRYGEKGAPAPWAMAGAGVVVTDDHGRVLLGRTTGGVWECPGGKREEGESWEQAAVRELAEETGLRAVTRNARVHAFLTDSAHGITRVTAAVRVLRHRGSPSVREPHHIRRWEWHEPAELAHLPQPLFTPSAQVLESVWPGLLPGLPPVDRRLLVPEEPDGR
ncbi:NUDIX domain-containing protein [Streptomyces sp. NPDC049954]|uniref:bifunctional class I SAM-dependent methyltransferase/NUDIX hydrolase n=1 Tax=Streptomyces sp. NPDC049954 TaxID=3155779 RepID=UPI0034177EC9